MPPIQPVSRATRGIRNRSGLWGGGKRRAARCFGFGIGILKIGVRGDVRNRWGADFLSTGSGLAITNESRFRQILSDVPGS